MNKGLTAVLGLALATAVAASSGVALLASCASSGGSTYSSAESGEAAAAARARKPAQPANPPPATRPPAPGAPAERPSLPRADSPQGGGEFTFRFGGGEEGERIPMGTLLLENLEPGSSIFVDGTYHLGSTIRLGLGSHTLQVRRFGYIDFEASAFITWDQTARLGIVYERAPFSIRSLEARPRSFDPADPGYLGSCEILVSVSARGDGRATVLDSKGALIRSLGEKSFERPSTSLRWDGRDDQGRVLPVGDYLIRVQGSGPDGTADNAEARVSISSGLFARSTTLYSGVSGTLFAPDARSLEPGRFELASGGELHLAPSGSAMAGLGTAQAGLRFGLPSSQGPSELDFSYMGVFWQDRPDINSFSITGAWKYSLGGAPLASPSAAAVYIKATVARFFGQDPENSVAPSWDGTTRYAGLSLGLPLEYSSGSLRGFAVPEIEISGYYPTWADPGAPWSTPGFFSWAYLRLGLEYSSGRYSLGLSGALRSTPFGGRLGLSGPYPLGLELRWHAPASALVLSFLVTGEIEGLSSYYLGAGLGLGFRY